MTHSIKTKLCSLVVLASICCLGHAQSRARVEDLLRDSFSMSSSDAKQQEEDHLQLQQSFDEVLNGLAVSKLPTSASSLTLRLKQIAADRRLQLPAFEEMLSYYQLPEVSQARARNVPNLRPSDINRKKTLLWEYFLLRPASTHAEWKQREMAALALGYIGDPGSSQALLYVAKAIVAASQDNGIRFEGIRRNLLASLSKRPSASSLDVFMELVEATSQGMETGSRKSRFLTYSRKLLVGSQGGMSQKSPWSALVQTYVSKNSRTSRGELLRSWLQKNAASQALGE